MEQARDICTQTVLYLLPPQTLTKMFKLLVLLLVATQVVSSTNLPVYTFQCKMLVACLTNMQKPLIAPGATDAIAQSTLNAASGRSLLVTRIQNVGNAAAAALQDGSLTQSAAYNIYAQNLKNQRDALFAIQANAVTLVQAQTSVAAMLATANQLLALH